MIDILTFWELGWNSPIKEYDLWEYPLKDFDVNNFYVSPISGIYKENTSIQEILSTDIENFLNKKRNENKKIVFVVENGDIKLQNFVHPINVLYVFGKTSFNPKISYGKENDLSVKIETKFNLGLLWGHQAATILLYDRFIKMGI